MTDATTDDSTDADDKRTTTSTMDETIRELAAQLDTIIEADDEGLWIDPKGEQQPWIPYSGDETAVHQFVCGTTGRGKTTRLVNWWKQTTARDEESSIWIDPKRVDGKKRVNASATGPEIGPRGRESEEETE